MLIHKQRCSPSHSNVFENSISRNNLTKLLYLPYYCRSVFFLFIIRKTGYWKKIAVTAFALAERNVQIQAVSRSGKCMNIVSETYILKFSVRSLVRIAVHILNISVHNVTGKNACTERYLLQGDLLHEMNNHPHHSMCRDQRNIPQMYLLSFPSMHQTVFRDVRQYIWVLLCVIQGSHFFRLQDKNYSDSV